MEPNKTDIYENVRKDATAVASCTTRDINKDKPSIQTKVPTTGAERHKCQTEEEKCIAVNSYDHYYQNDSNTARMPTHNHHLYLKHLLEYHNTEHDYKAYG